MIKTHPEGHFTKPHTSMTVHGYMELSKDLKTGGRGKGNKALIFIFYIFFYYYIFWQINIYTHTGIYNISQ